MTKKLDEDRVDAILQAYTDRLDCLDEAEARIERMIADEQGRKNRQKNMFKRQLVADIHELDDEDE